jgi:6-methylsalicylate decarboxylase
MRVDVHAHYFPTEYLDLLDRFGGTQPGTIIARNCGGDKTRIDLRRRFSRMAAAHVDMQVISVGPQQPYFETESHAVEAARAANEMYADLVRRYPDRLAAFACVPLPHLEASIAEVRRSLDELGMAGVIVTTSVLGKTIADPAFDPLFAELDRRGAVLFIHQAVTGAYSPFIVPYNLTSSVGTPLEDTLCILHLMISGALARYRNIKIISAHLGGVLPFLMQRIDSSSEQFMRGAAGKPSGLLGSLWYDVVNGHGPALRCASDTFGADRLVLGTDYPYWRRDYHEFLLGYMRDSGLPRKDISRILDRNAAQLLGLGPVARTMKKNRPSR